MSDELKPQAEITPQPGPETTRTTEATQQGLTEQLGSAMAQATTQEEMESLLDFAKSQGVDLSQFGDARGAAGALLNIYRNYPQMEQLARYGQEYLRHQEQFQQYLAGQKPAPQPSEQKPPWAPPYARSEVQKLIAQYYQRDANGQLVPRGMIPPSVEQKVNEYISNRQEWEQGILHDPETALQPLVEKLFEKQFEKQFKQVQHQNDMQDFLRRNADWLFFKNPDQTPAWNQFTPAGAVFWQYTQQAAQMGIQGIQNQEMYARAMMENAWYRQQQAAGQQQPSSNNQAAARPTNNRIANYQANENESVPKGVGALRAMLKQAVAANGIDLSA